MRRRGNAPDPLRRFAASARAGAPGDLRGLQAAMRRYLEHRAVLGASEQALFTTEWLLRAFIAWADERGVTHPQQVSLAVLQRYQRWLHHYRKSDGEPLNLRTQSTRVSMLRGWFKWLTRKGEIGANPAAELELPRRVRRLPRRVLSAEEAEAVIAGADTGSATGLRDRAMMEVLYATGLRRMELVGLELGDLDEARALVLVRQGKGGHDRLIPLGERALYWVRQYLDRVRPQLAWDAHDATLFLSADGRRLGLGVVTQLMARYVEQAGIGKRGSCHLWRHTAATLMLEGGADIRFIQALLGHSQLSTTQIYTQVAVAQLQRVHAMTHPGVKRRERAQDASGSEGAPTVEDTSTPCPGPQSGAGALLQALADEAEEEADADDDGEAAADA